jgi:hypothetical protein
MWLTVSNPDQNLVYEAHTIQPYEVESLTMFADNYIEGKLNNIIGSKYSAQSIINQFLDLPPPTWEQLAKLVSDISIPDLKIGSTMKETTSQLVPASFPDQIRDELMAFLAFVINDKIPDDDPVEYKIKLLPLSMIGGLLRGHLRCMIDKTTWPSYVKYMIQAARGQLESPKRALVDILKKTPWSLFLHKCFEEFPSWLNEAVRLAKQLNDAGKVVVGLPISKAAAKRSRRLWKQRLATLTYDLRMQGHVNNSAFGLTDMVYLGSAYRWPHRHMKFITRLGDSAENVPFLQVLTVPLSAIERIKRVLPSVIRIIWSASHSNLELFNDSDNEWQVQEGKIISSIQKSGSLRRLRKRFGPVERADIHPMTSEEAKVVDRIVRGVYLDDLENADYLDFWQITTSELKKVVANFVNRGLIQVQYNVQDSRLVSIATIAQGEPKQVASLIESFLDNSPTSLAMLSDDGGKGIIVSRLPEDAAFQIASKLPTAAFKRDMEIRCLRPTSFQRYTQNLYQRLLNKDGSWDDDVTAFLSQARSKRKELSESNA